MLNIQKKIAEIRKLLIENKIDYYLISHSDEYQNEFLPIYSKRLEWISDFTGSAGDVIIGKNEAYLFVDGRYTIQAQNEVSKKHYKIYNYSKLTPLNLLRSKKARNVGFEGDIQPYFKIKSYAKSLGKKTNLIPLEKNLIDQVWKSRPKKIKSKPFVLDKKFAGKNAKNKVNKIINYLKKSKTDYYVLTACDSISWVFNLRSKDIEYTPIFLSQAIIQQNGKCYIFSDCTNNLKTKLNIDVSFKKQKDINSFIKEHGINKSFICDINTISHNLANTIKNKGKLILQGDVIQLLKSKKNKTEQRGMVNSHIRDGASLTKFIYWIKNQVQNKTITELDAIKYLDNLRRGNKHFFSLSFPTIAGTGANGAIVHYRANKSTNKKIKKSDLLLVDSGAQYFDGTTDVTRTISFNKPRKDQIEMYTRVLKGHIAVACSKFKFGEKGKKLDNLARKYLKEINCNFEHGTGHGVGCFLNVHESPPSISQYSKISFEDGMIVSNEPGFYKKNDYGIRIESLILSQLRKGYLHFKTLTMAPLDRSLINAKMLSKKEIEWIDKYHLDVKLNILRFMNKHEKKWLINQTSSLLTS